MLLDKVKENIDSFTRDTIKLADGYDFSQYQTVRKIDLYYSSQFISGPRDSDGFKKFFYNIVKSRVNTASKAIDLDTKNIRIVATEGQSYYPSWFFQRDLAQYLKEQKFGDLLNWIVQTAPRYGSIVLKSVDDDLKPTHIPNLIVDPSSETIQSSPYIIEKHLYTREEYERLAEEKGWEKTEEVLALYEKHEAKLIRVVEWYGYAPEKDFGGRGDKVSRGMCLITGLEFYTNDRESSKPIIVFKKRMKLSEDWPYRDWHWDKEHGRWLGIGVVEDLFINQESINEVNNLRRKSLYWSSKKLFQTTDQTAPRNLFIETQNGDVFQVKSGIQPVSMEDRNFPAYSDEFNRLEKNSDERAFSFEVNTGESLPSGTPFRLGAILANAVNSHFDLKRESLGLFIEGLIYDLVIPKLMRRKNKSHVVNVTGDMDDLDKIDALIQGTIMQKAVEDFYQKNNAFPSVQEFEEESNSVKLKMADQKQRFLEIPDKFYEDLKYRIEVIVTGEQQDVKGDIETYTNLLQVLGSNPTIVQDPQLRKILEKILNLAGRSPIDTLSLARSPIMPGVGMPVQGMSASPQAAPNLISQLGQLT